MTEIRNKKRAPIVTILGHVDHGKTSLLDKIRSSNVQKKEVGGITQKIGASVVDWKGNSITFIDTPGHAVFSNMRKSGARVADIIVLVVAADDGVKPQTKEAIEYMKKVNSPCIVALTKIDLPAANVENAITQLTSEEILLEGRGGDVPFVKLSAKTGEGVDDLMEMISLVSEVQEISGDPDGDLESVVVETSKEKGGILVTVVVKQGTLRVGENVFAGDVGAKIKGIFDHSGKNAKEILPGFPAQILGFKRSPSVASTMTVGTKNEVGDHKNTRPPVVGEDQVSVLVKSSSAGSLEALLQNMPDNVVIIDSGVGEVNETDVMTAKNNGAPILLFEVRVGSQIKKLAESEGVSIKNFSTVYELFEKLNEMVDEKTVKILGKAEILEIFPFNNQKVAGSKMISGKISKNSKVILMRKEEELGTSKVSSLKKQKTDVESVIQGEEFGCIFASKLDFEKGDVIVSVAK